MDQKIIAACAKKIRYLIILSTTEAGSGHLTSSLSATDLMTGLLFGGFFHFDVDNPSYHNNDRLLFSKGHASPLLYALWALAGKVSEDELKTLRKFGSSLEGHPSMEFPYTEAATGSLGQGLSIGVGMAINAKYIDMLSYRTYVLLGDSEMAEGSVWEAIASASHYKLDNLTAVIDVNRLGQRGETMYGHHTEEYEKKLKAFGWETIVVDGHTHEEIQKAYKDAFQVKNKPQAIIARTIKGKGISFLEDKDGWHGKALPAADAQKAIAELGDIDKTLHGVIAKSEAAEISNFQFLISKQTKSSNYQKGEMVATRKAYGNALVRIFPEFPNMVVLDAEVSNSTYADIFKNAYPDRFFEMYIAEQNMVGVALGLSRRGKIPFVSSFAAFLSRAHDQIRMAQYSDANIKFVGSHAGVSIGEDGASQMGLEDIALFRGLLGSVVLYPSDAVSCDALVEEAAKHTGIVYIRTTRMDTPILYDREEKFSIGGSKILKESKNDIITVIGAGVTLFEALQAYEELIQEGIHIRVIDVYSIKPLDEKTLTKAGEETKAIITVEDHYLEGGIGEVITALFATKKIPVYSLAVMKKPKSGKPKELLAYEEIDANAIIKKVKEIV